ncbi:MAG: Fe-S cluster assembly protein HesB [Candidatus Woesearchaeota archaeon]
MYMPSSHAILHFQETILSWYAQHKRDVPWRHTQDPYAIIVSEIMLQQTQVSRVIGYYHRFLQLYPNIKTLAQAQTVQLLQVWSGLGYNSRALRLRSMAQHVVQHHKAKMPHTQEALLALPGVGPYTAGAVMAFAYNKDVVVIDTNIRRVILDWFDIPDTIHSNELQEIVWACLPKGQARVWYNALMDWGAMERTAKKTGIKPLSKQSAFEGSTRQIRGYIMKHVIHNPLSIDTIPFDAQKTKEVIQKMKKEHLLIQEDTTLYIR